MTLHGIIFFSILTVFNSCNGQVKNAESISEATKSVGKIVSEIDKSIWVIFQDRKYNYWFGSNGKGAYCFDGKNIKQFTTEDGLYSNHIRGIQEDKFGNIYFDTPNGVSKFDGGKFISLIPIKWAVNQWKLQPDDLWFKRNGDVLGALRYDGDTLYQLDFSEISSNKISSEYAVFSIYRDSRGNVWFGTLTAGVGCFDGITLNWIYEDEFASLEDGRAPAVRSILEDEDGYFWFSNLIYQYSISLNSEKSQQSFNYERVKRIELSQQEVKMNLPYYTSAVTDKKNIWMTTYNEGVWKYDGENLTNYLLNDAGTNVLTMFIYKDNAGSLWLGTDNAGVYKFNGKTFEKFKPI